MAKKTTHKVKGEDWGLEEAATPDFKANKAKIKVVGVGGGGGHAVSRMRDEFHKSIEFIAINTDNQDLEFCNVDRKIYIGKNVTRGLGAGMNPDLGRQAAEENRNEIADALSGADLVFITAGLGGGTGSGASSTVADIAHELGAIVVAVLTKPFSFEGLHRARIADEALSRIKDKIDSYIVVNNDKIFDVINKDTSIVKAFECIDNVLKGAVQGISDLISMPGTVNVDFADIKAIMQNSGGALVGVGLAEGKDRSINAVNQVLTSPLIDINIAGAKGILFSVSGRDMKMLEVNEIAKTINSIVGPGAKTIFGVYNDRRLKMGELKVTLIATGFEDRDKSLLQVGKTPVIEVERGSDLFSDVKISSKEELPKPPLPTPSFKLDIKPLGTSTEPVKMDSRPNHDPHTKPITFREPISKEKLNAVVEDSKDWNRAESKEKVIPPPDPKTKEDSFWDIPAFMRRKKK